jgi:ribosomal protein L21
MVNYILQLVTVTVEELVRQNKIKFFVLFANKNWQIFTGNLQAHNKVKIRELTTLDVLM